MPPDAPRRQDGLGTLHDWSFPPSTVSGLGLPSLQQSHHWKGWPSHPLPGLWLLLAVLFSSLVIKLLPSYIVKKEGTGT